MLGATSNTVNLIKRFEQKALAGRPTSDMRANAEVHVQNHKDVEKQKGLMKDSCVFLTQDIAKLETKI